MMPNYTDTTKTIDFVEVTIGLRVMTNDWDWGTVESRTCDYSDAPHGEGRTCEHWDGWFNVRLDSGGTTLQDGTRMLVNPQRYYPTAPVDPKNEGR